MTEPVLSIDGALAALKAAEENQCGCLGDTLARAIEDLEAALMRPVEHVKPIRNRQLLCEWAKRHGIDPARVLVPAVFTHHPATNQYTVEVCEVDAEGKVIYDGWGRLVTKVVSFEAREPWPA